MHRVALIYNPAAGQHPGRRAAIVASVAAVFEGAGVTVSSIPTHSVDSIPAQVQAAIHDGCDTVVVCGGDGTIHHVLQGMVGTSAALGVIPLGTANALAIDLGLPKPPGEAAQTLLRSTPVQVSLGRVTFHDLSGNARSRYYIVAAGIGADAYFFSRLDPRAKQQWGYMHYVVEAARLLLTHTFPMFTAAFSGSGRSHSHETSQLLAVRVSNFGGLVGKLVPGAVIGQNALKVVSFKTRSRICYLRFLLAAAYGRPAYSSHIEVVDCATVACSDPGSTAEPTFVEADGELLGTLPARLEVVPDALTLLIPPKTRSSSSRFPQYPSR